MPRFKRLSGQEQALVKNRNNETHISAMGETVCCVPGGGQPFDIGSVSVRNDTVKDVIFRVEAV